MNQHPKGSTVSYSVKSGEKTLSWQGQVRATRGETRYVVFDGGGHWFKASELTESIPDHDDSGSDTLEPEAFMRMTTLLQDEAEIVSMVHCVRRVKKCRMLGSPQIIIDNELEMLQLRFSQLMEKIK